MKDAALNMDGSRILTAGAFEFALASELKRALRAQSYLTLVAVEAQRVWEGLAIAADEGTVAELAAILAHEVRDTDVLAATEPGSLWLMLLDTDQDGAWTVIDRMVARVQSYQFSTSVSIAVGAACCPTHAADGGSLKREARSRPMLSARRGHHSASTMERS